MKKLIILILLMLLCACSQNLSQPYADINENAAAILSRGILAPQPIEPLDDAFVRGINDFGFDAAELLYVQDNNLALSPASIELALCMTREGAAGETADEMAQALRLSGLTDKQVADACKSLMWRANTGGMEAANAVWLLPNYAFCEEFVDTCTSDYMSDVFPLIIPGAKQSVNNWADEKTHGRIKEVLNQEPDELTRIILANALYFLGDWELPFEANDTYEREFYTPVGTVNTDFMHSERHVPYYKNDNFSMISLSFKNGEDEGKYAMAFLLPKEGTSLNEMLSVLDAQTFSAALGGAQEQKVRIRLPKFEFLYKNRLNDMLKTMGLKRAFDANNADFSAMVQKPMEEPLYISFVDHMCYIRIDELGAEAAAVTVVNVCGSAAPPENEPPKFYADRPFVFTIYSLEDGAIAFMGAVNDPTLE